MGGLLERIERKKPQGCGERAVRQTRHALNVDELGERLERQLSEAFAFACEPFLEGGWMRTLPGQTLEEVTAIQTNGPFKGIRRSLRHELLEVDRVYIDSIGVQDDGVPVGPEAGRVNPG